MQTPIMIANVNSAAREAVNFIDGFGQTDS